MHRHVPGLGDVQGVDFSECPHVEQYRGIPYGSISARFRQATISTSWPDGKWNGTEYGPICPFPRMVIGGSIVQKPLPPQHDYDMNETTCLNLNITCPKELPSGKGYPVVVWVHGYALALLNFQVPSREAFRLRYGNSGGNVIGSGSATDYNGKNLVNFSVEQKLPVVSVTINYRLGAFGFLASDAIQSDNEASGDHGAGNYGIRDQLLACQWVKDHISAFGGDPSRITVNGESAGAIDTHILLCSKTPTESIPFHQAILQSGAAPLTVRTLKHQQVVYDKVLAHFKVAVDLPPQEKLELLRKVPADDLVKGYSCLGSPVSSWQATVDGYFLDTLPKFSTISSIVYPSTVRRLLIGDCALEGLIFIEKVKKMQWTFEKIRSLSVSILGDERSRKVLQAFEISVDSSPEDLLSGIARLLTDAEWSQPIEAIARSFQNGEVFYYHVAEGNPFDGANKGMAHHAVDLLYVFLTFQEHLPEANRTMAEELVRYWLVFINGGEPWKPYDQKSHGTSSIMHFGPNCQVKEAPESAKPAYQTLRLCEELQDSISELAAAIRGEQVFF